MNAQNMAMQNTYLNSEAANGPSQFTPSQNVQNAA